jgi:hypothetical protein
MREVNGRRQTKMVRRISEHLAAGRTTEALDLARGLTSKFPEWEASWIVLSDVLCARAERFAVGQPGLARIGLA